MAYGSYGSNPGNSGNETMSEGMHDESMPHKDMDHEDMGTLHVSPDMLPEGMKLNKGDIVEFRVIGDQDADGDWPVEYNMGEKKEEEDDSVENALRKAVSPRETQEEAS